MRVSLTKGTKSVTPSEIIDRASIAEVWAALGGGDLRRGRGKAFWRGGDGLNVSINGTRGVFFDHARAEGGGMLHLIETALGCDRKTALHWLAAHQGVELNDRRVLTPDERRQYAQRRGRAESAAADLTTWRRDTLQRLRDDRNRLYLSENAVSAVARTLLAATGGVGDDEAWAHIFEHARDDQRADQIDCEIQRIESATPAELVIIRRASELGRQVA